MKSLLHKLLASYVLHDIDAAIAKLEQLLVEVNEYDKKEYKSVMATLECAKSLLEDTSNISTTSIRFPPKSVMTDRGGK